MEQEADEVFDVSNHENKQRKHRMYKEAFRMYQLAAKLGSTKGNAHMLRLKSRGIGAHQEDGPKEENMRDFHSNVFKKSY